MRYSHNFMQKLDRKLIRDLYQMRGQAIAITLVIAAGIATFVMSMCAYASLQEGTLDQDSMARIALDHGQEFVGPPL